MKEKRCEQVCLAMMALTDGESSHLPLKEIEEHLSSCAPCREERQGMLATCRLLDSQKRRRSNQQLWQRIERRLPHAAPSMVTAHDWRVFATLGVLLFAHRVIDLCTNQELGFWYALIPVAATVILFAYLKENPFKIAVELNLNKGM